MNANFLKIMQVILAYTLPYIQDLIESKVVPTLKRKTYERLNLRADKLINDLAQNASKIDKEENEIKKAAYLEGTKLGLAMIKALASKLNQAVDEIEKVLVLAA